MSKGLLRTMAARSRCEICNRRTFIIHIGKDGVKRCPGCHDKIYPKTKSKQGCNMEKDLEGLREKAYTLAKIIKIVQPHQTKGESVEDTVKRMFEDAALVRKIKKEK